jgi:hypothetical protein
MADRIVRRDIRTPEAEADGSAWDDRALMYARAVGVMQARSPDDPTSWAAQAALHRAAPRGTWFFLPWLRIRLWYFERIVRAIVVEGGGPRDWALPFWSYGDRPASAVLPRALAVPELPDGAPNPLFRRDGERPACLNAGRPLPDAVASAARALAARTFSPGFGGDPGVPGDPDAPRPPGLLEAQPHDSVIAVLGPNAAVDPILPLHLANIDRLWEVWLARGEGRANPAQFDWTDRAFSFHDADGRLRSVTAGQAGDLANLDYVYSGVPSIARDESVLKPGADAGPLAEWRGRREEIAGGAGLELGPEPRRVALRPRAEESPDSAAARVYLCLDEATGGAGAPGGVWEVRLGDEHAAPVGTIAFPHPLAETRRFVFDVTDTVRASRDPIVVSFHPALPLGFRVEPAPTARVGRVALMRG